MSLHESIHHVTKVAIEKKPLAGDTDREILSIEVTFKVSSFASDHTFQETFVTKELTLFLDKEYVLDIPEDALL